MLRLLLDADCDPDVADAAIRQEPSCPIIAMRVWEGSRWRTASDEVILQRAQVQGLTLVTRDVHTIPALLATLRERGVSHAGVILVSERAFPRHDVGALARAIVRQWRTDQDVDWRDRVLFLSRL